MRIVDRLLRFHAWTAYHRARFRPERRSAEPETLAGPDENVYPLW